MNLDGENESENAERTFTIEAPQRRVWNLLGRALLNSPLNLEKIEVLDPGSDPSPEEAVLYQEQGETE